VQDFLPVRGEIAEDRRLKGRKKPPAMLVGGGSFLMTGLFRGCGAHLLEGSHLLADILHIFGFGVPLEIGTQIVQRSGIVLFHYENSTQQQVHLR
jgi:hypothetical protein